MSLFIGITDSDWYNLIASRSDIEEVNFWQPGGSRQFKALRSGELFLFKPHRQNVIIGGGIFTHSTLLPISLAWDAFGLGNGATSLQEMRQRVEKYRRTSSLPHEDYTVGCIILSHPFFLHEAEWIPVPHDWKPNIVQGRGYDISSEPGRTLYQSLIKRVQLSDADLRRYVGVTERYGKPYSFTPRLGQGAFRVLVTDAYNRRCAVTGEKVLPVLEAAHIRPYADGGPHQVENGLLLRSDLHTLFDRGYMTITTDFHLEVSHRIRDDYENGRDYYALQGALIREPIRGMPRPSRDNLSWHNVERYLG